MANGATIEVLYFAQVAEHLGIRRETQALGDPVRADAWLAALVDQQVRMVQGRLAGENPK